MIRDPGYAHLAPIPDLARLLDMPKSIRVTGIDHLGISVSNFKSSRAFYDRLLKFLGFKILDEFDDAIGWTNGKTRIWISQADTKGKKYKYREGDVGFHHYAFQLSSRKAVDALEAFLKDNGIEIVDPAAEYYENYYAVYFVDPDGLRFEGMRYGKR